MKKLFALTTLGFAALLSNNALAASTATGTFGVNVSLTSVCQVVTVPSPAFSYSSFQTSAATFSTTFDVKCTNTLPITSIVLDQTSITDSATNLAYTLALSNVPTVGTGVAQTVTITGNMAAAQSGTCATATCSNTASTNKTRTLTINY